MYVPTYGQNVDLHVVIIFDHPQSDVVDTFGRVCYSVNLSVYQTV